MSVGAKKRTFSEDLTSDDSVANGSGPRRKCGKWSVEEEEFANQLIGRFQSGNLMDCEEGSTLRSYLARKLNCSPMRISKKFAGQGIGKFVYTKHIKGIPLEGSIRCVSPAETLSSNSHFIPPPPPPNPSLPSHYSNVDRSQSLILPESVKVLKSGDLITSNRTAFASLELDCDDFLFDSAETEAETWKNVLAHYCGSVEIGQF